MKFQMEESYLKKKALDSCNQSRNSRKGFIKIFVID